jgi:hypothetical protein
VWQDIEFNQLAAEAGLAVVKYARFMHFKRNFTPAAMDRQLQQSAVQQSTVHVYLPHQPLYPTDWNGDDIVLSAAAAAAWEARLQAWAKLSLRSVHLDMSFSRTWKPALPRPLHQFSLTPLADSSSTHVLLHASIAASRSIRQTQLSLGMTRLSDFIATAASSGAVFLSFPLFLLQQLCDATAASSTVASVADFLRIVSYDNVLLSLDGIEQCTVYGSCPATQLGTLLQHSESCNAHWIGVRLPASADRIDVEHLAAADSDVDMAPLPAPTLVARMQHVPPDTSGTLFALSLTPGAAAAGFSSPQKGKRTLDAVSPPASAATATVASASGPPGATSPASKRSKFQHSSPALHLAASPAAARMCGSARASLAGAAVAAPAAAAAATAATAAAASAPAFTASPAAAALSTVAPIPAGASATGAAAIAAAAPAVHPTRAISDQDLAKAMVRHGTQGLLDRKPEKPDPAAAYFVLLHQECGRSVAEVEAAWRSAKEWLKSRAGLEGKATYNRIYKQTMPGLSKDEKQTEKERQREALSDHEKEVLLRFMVFFRAREAHRGRSGRAATQPTAASVTATAAAAAAAASLSPPYFP